MTTLSIIMIVKNEGRFLPMTLPDKVAGADEVIVVDTGSTDNTREMAARLGAKVYDFTWVNDFAAARNESIKHASGDWLMWLDADEYIKKDDLLKLKKLLGETEETAFGLKLAECKPGTYDYLTSYYRTKIFKNGLGIKFLRPINEELYLPDGRLPAAKELDITVYHWGGPIALSEDPAERERKKRRNIAMFEAAVARNPNDTNCLFFLARDYTAVGEYQKAKKCLENYLEIVKEPPEKVADGLHEYIQIRIRLMQIPGLETYCEDILKLYPDSCRALFNLAQAHILQNNVAIVPEILTRMENIADKRVNYGGLIKDETMSYYYLKAQYGIMGGDFKTALEYFRKHYGLVPTPQVQNLINICEKKLAAGK